MFPLLLLQDLTNRFFLSMHGYLLERAIFYWISKYCKRILSSAIQLTFSRTQVSSEHSPASANALELPLIGLRSSFEVVHSSGEQVMDFVNELGYPEEIYFVSRMHSLYKQYRNFSSWANLYIPTKKPTPYVIPYCRFTKLIIYYLGSRHNIHRRHESAVHVTGDDFLLAKEGGKKKTTSKADNPQKPISAKQSKPALAKLMRYFAFGRHLDELHVTWAHLGKKRIRLWTNTKTLEDLCSQSLETTSSAKLDAVTTHQVTTSHISRRCQLAPTQTQI
ncbi:hypothetical protein Tco_0848455 [Tanacetum coccineum]